MKAIDGGYRKLESVSFPEGRTGTEDLARLLGMDKGTVGEHLRPAEKNIIDHLLSS